jgi:hypothetical protein
MMTRTQLLLNVAERWSMDYTSHSTTVQEIMAEKSQGSGSLAFGSDTDRATTGKFPFVTLPNFEWRAQQAQELLSLTVATSPNTTTTTTSATIQTIFLPFVPVDQTIAWENYTAQNQGWLYQQQLDDEDSMPFPTIITTPMEPVGLKTVQLPSWYVVSRGVVRIQQCKNEFVSSSNSHSISASCSFFLLHRQMSPTPLYATDMLLINTLSFPVMVELTGKVLESRQPVLSSFLSSHDAVYRWLKQQDDKAATDKTTAIVAEHRAPAAISILLQPIFASLEQPDADIVGILLMTVPWSSLYLNQPPPANSFLAPGMHVVMTDSCSKTQYTYTGVLDEKQDKVEFVLQGLGDFHNHDYDDQVRSTTLSADHESMLNAQKGVAAVKDEAAAKLVFSCEYKIDIYPSVAFEQEFRQTNPTGAADTTEATEMVQKNAIVATAIVVIIFFVTGTVFLLYDYVVQLRQEKVMKTATKTQAIVSSLFPKSVQDRMMKHVEEELADEAYLAKVAKSQSKESAAAAAAAAADPDISGPLNRHASFKGRTKEKLNNFLPVGAQQVVQHKSKPIADLFVSATLPAPPLSPYSLSCSCQ